MLGSSRLFSLLPLCLVTPSKNCLHSHWRRRSATITGLSTLSMATWVVYPASTASKALRSGTCNGQKPCKNSLSNSGLVATLISEYQPPSQEEKAKMEKKLGYYPHQDSNMLSIVKQIQTDGLEFKTRDGDWIVATPSPDSIFVMAGCSFRAWTNGRACAPFHRILIGGEVTRYSCMLFSVTSDNDLVEAPQELVDENHPRLFIPFSHTEFTQFCASEKGAKADDMLEAFCADSKA